MTSPTGNPRSITAQVNFGGGQRGKAKPPEAAGPEPLGRVPRVARLMALAIKFDGLLRSGAVADQAELAELAHVTRARVTQIMNLLHLAPDIQEEIIHLPLVTRGRDPVVEHELRDVAGVVHWAVQRALWERPRRARRSVTAA